MIAFPKSRTLAIDTNHLNTMESFGNDNSFHQQRSESPLLSPTPQLNHSDFEERTIYEYNDFDDNDSFSETPIESEGRFTPDDYSPIPMDMLSDLSLLKRNLVSRLCYYMTASSSQVLVVFHQFITLVADHIAVIVADLLNQYASRLRNRFKKLNASEEMSICDVEGRVLDSFRCFTRIGKSRSITRRDLHKFEVMQIICILVVLVSISPAIKELRQLFRKRYSVKSRDEIKDDSFTCYYSEYFVRENQPIESIQSRFVIFHCDT